MAAQCATPIKARIMRLIKLDECGVPVSGASSAVVTSNGFVSIEASPDYEEGEEFIQRRADGSLCVNEKDPDELKRIELNVTLCGIDPDAVVIATGERLLTTSATGTGVALGEGQLTARFSLEVWQPVAGSGACVEGDQQYIYWLFPNVTNGKLNDFTFENDVFEFGFTGETNGGSADWTTSIGALTTGLGSNTVQDGEHVLFNITTTAPPTSACGAVAL